MNVAIRSESAGRIWQVEVCAGSGMLGAGLKLALGGRLSTVAYVERESYAAACLVARMEEEALDIAPILDDVNTSTDPEFVDRLRPYHPLLLSGGYPCQPFSCAGKQLGAADERHLWPAIARLIGAIEPEVCFFENVPGHLTRGFDCVHADLEGLGYRVAAGLFSAEEVGASHKRERLFILAVRACGGFGELRESSGIGGQSDGCGEVVADAENLFGRREFQQGKQKKYRRCGLAGKGVWLDDPSRNGCFGGKLSIRPRGQNETAGHVGQSSTKLGDTACDNEQWDWLSGTYREGVEAGGPSGELADANESGFRTGGKSETPDVGQTGPTISDAGGERLSRAECAIKPPGSVAEYGLPLFAPGPGERDAWEFILHRSPYLAPATERELCRTPDGVAYRLDADRLRLTGNGIVPLAAAYAFVSLWASLDFGKE